MFNKARGIHIISANDYAVYFFHFIEVSFITDVQSFSVDIQLQLDK